MRLAVAPGGGGSCKPFFSQSVCVFVHVSIIKQAHCVATVAPVEEYWPIVETRHKDQTDSMQQQQKGTEILFLVVSFLPSSQFTISVCPPLYNHR